MWRLVIVTCLLFLLAGCGLLEEDQDPNEILAEVMYEEVVVDDEFVRIYAKNLERTPSYFEDDLYTIHFELENKREEGILVQARDETFDGLDANPYPSFNADLLAFDKKERKYETSDLQKILINKQGKLGFRFIIFEEASYKTLAEHEVEFELK